MYPFIFFLLFSVSLPQLKTEQTLDMAYLNAKKGIYWGLSHSSAKQNIIKNNLIDNDRLISAVRIDKEINGVHIESTGYFEGYEVKISMYKSTDNLIKEGFIQPARQDSLSRKTASGKRKTTNLK